MNTFPPCIHPLHGPGFLLSLRYLQGWTQGLACKCTNQDSKPAEQQFLCSSSPLFLGFMTLPLHHPLPSWPSPHQGWWIFFRISFLAPVLPEDRSFTPCLTFHIFTSNFSRSTSPYLVIFCISVFIFPCFHTFTSSSMHTGAIPAAPQGRNFSRE